jgi:hypothetical protein
MLCIHYILWSKIYAINIAYIWYIIFYILSFFFLWCWRSTLISGASGKYSVTELLRLQLDFIFWDKEFVTRVVLHSWSSCLCLLNAGIPGMCYHTGLLLYNLFIFPVKLTKGCFVSSILKFKPLTGVWTQGFTLAKQAFLPHEPHCQSSLLWLFWGGFSWPVLSILVLSHYLITATQIARITGTSHQCMADGNFLCLKENIDKIYVW